MIPMDLFSLKKKHRYNCKDGKRDGFLYNLELEERKGTAGTFETDSVRRNHKAVFKKRHAPREGYDGYQRPVFYYACLRESQIAVPGKCHEYV